MKLTAKGTMKTRAAARKVSSFGKTWKSGETHFVAYPIFHDEDGKPQILVGAAWGHPMNPKEISAKSIFWPSHAEFVDDEPVTQDLAYQISKIAPLILKGQYVRAVEKIENSPLPAAAKKQSLREVDKDFEIQDDGRIGKQPAVGRLKYIITTEVIDIPQKDSGAPDVSKARLVGQDLSDKKVRIISELMANPRYAPEIGDRWFIVQYAFGNSGDRKIDGADVAITAPESGMRLHERYPDEYEQLLSHLELLPEDSDMIMKRNTSFTKKDEKILMSAFQSYWIFNEEYLGDLKEDDDVDRVKKLCSTLKKLNVPVRVPTLVEAMEEEEEGFTVSPDPYTPDKVPTMTDLIDKEDVQTAKAESGEDEDFTTGLEGMDISSLN
jgi:hypothetical protein